MDLEPPITGMMPYEYAGETQGATQQASQYASFYNGMETPFFGCLQPCHSALRRIDFQKTHAQNTIGRGPNNDFVLSGMRVSYQHCRIIWDGREDRQSQVVVHDSSSNGTWINGARVPKGQSRILRDGNEIAFGSPVPQQNSVEDYRYIYRHLASHELTGIHAHYDMAHELGRGTFATVMKAMSRETGEWFAVKIIHGNKVRPTTSPTSAAAAAAAANGDGNDVVVRGGSNNNNHHQLQSFGREISILETLDHPNICRLRETFEPEGRENDFYLVLELVEGGDLLDYILANDGLDEPTSQHITRQMCDALSYIHAKGITHRDLKPENVLLTRDDPPNVKVADFGLAKVVDSLTMLRTMCGTPSYLAPEVVNQGKPNRGYDQLVDSWSVGVIVFSMLTNTGPFIEDENEPDFRRRIALRYIDWRALRLKGVSASAQHFIRRLLDANPATRMTLTDALRHPWLDHSALPLASTSTTDNATTSENTAASQDGVDRNFSELSELSELEMDDDDEDGLAAQAGGDVSMLSAIPSVDDNMPGVDLLNITSPARLRTRPRAPLERRSQVIARELAAEDQTGPDSPTTTTTNEKQSGGKRARTGSTGLGSPDDVAMAEGAGGGAGGAGGGGESDGEEEVHDGRRRRHVAKRGRLGEGIESKSPSPPSGTGNGNGNGNGTGRSLRSRNGPAAAGTPRR
ncbi:kinase-like domain-containing protein [Lactifluus volemus]|nr:kinase-like domain-containing protein [Lactifluus volemus]